MPPKRRTAQTHYEKLRGCLLEAVLDAKEDEDGPMKATGSVKNGVHVATGGGAGYTGRAEAVKGKYIEIEISKDKKWSEGELGFFERVGLKPDGKTVKDRMQ